MGRRNAFVRVCINMRVSKFNEYVFKLLHEDMHGDNWASTSWTDVINGKEITVTLKDLLEYIKHDSVVSIKTSILEPFALHKNKTDKQTLSNIEKSNLEYPIIVMKKSNGYQILDGHHRLQKAINNHIPNIKAKIIDLKKLPKEFAAIFS